ncbi:MAG: hypothetical protein JWR25_2065 [Noviherbaspirillum sp.]|jgi:hypothetical protein|nr:hypothetical protein [Noviherbaspirillum sp.]MDB5795686.1 hypothetical protein [Noviherbaspirillum sp.]
MATEFSPGTLLEAVMPKLTKNQSLLQSHLAGLEGKDLNNQDMLKLQLSVSEIQTSTTMATQLIKSAGDMLKEILSKIN